LIEGTTIKFGYGTIGVNSNFGVLRFIWIEPSQCVGEDLNSANIRRKRTIAFEYDNDMFKLRADLDILPELSYIIYFRGYILNFKNYNEASVNVVARHVDQVISDTMLLYAC